MKLEARQLACMRQQKLLFDDLNFTVRAGELLLVEGGNGTGKSSLLRLLSGLATPVRGEILWNGEALFRDEYRKNMHYCAHSNGIKTALTVRENLALAQHFCQQAAEATEEVLTELGLLAESDRRAACLSAGQKRRIALARLFIYPKKIWLLDEPFTALDRGTQQLFLSRLDTHLENGGLAVISSHHAFPPSPCGLRRDTVRLRLGVEG